VRSVVVAVVPAAVVAGLWLRLEEPRREGEAAVVVALALISVLLRPWWGRAAAAAAGALATLWLAFDAPPWDLVLLRGLWWERVGSRVDTGLRDFNQVFVPFDSVERWELHGLVLVVIFMLALAIGLCAAARWPLWGVAIVLVAAGVPTTLLEERVGLSSGIVVLAACLWLVAASRARLGHGNLRAFGLGGAVVLLAAVFAGASDAPSHAAVDWKDWELYGRVRGQVGLGYVWEAHYDGIRFPPQRTTVLRVRGTDRAAYWRASTLDAFDGTRWREYLYALSVHAPRGRLPVDPLLPAAAYDERRWVRQQVEIAALRSNRLPAAGTPVSIASSSFPQVAYLGGGVIGYGAGLAPGQRYTVWSYAPRPRPQQLAASAARYPRNVDRYLTLSGAQLPVFGSPSHDAVVDARLGAPYHDDLVPYRAVWDAARRVTRSATTPYDATLALERWFRSAGGFVYDEEPPRARGTPPLADFVLRTKRGYCQHFAGSMTLMLRLLGIPSRVAVGFTSGSLKDGVWTVTDHDAHAWVEVWFDGWGWLPFDPTPGRGAFSQTYTVASNSADAVLRLGGRPFVPQGVTPPRPGEAGGGTGEGGGGSPWPLAMLAVIVGSLASLGLVKSVRRRWRYRSGDPRAIASAARAELADRLTDQGVRLPARSTIPDVTRGLRAVGLNGTTFALAAARARYGPPASARTAAAETRRELRTLVRALRASLPVHRRLLGYLSLRSLRRA
jgi:transglutaminase-like putative cysteine protease